MWKRIRSFGYAFNGLRIIFIEEPNARIHLVAILSVMIAGYWLKVSIMEWISLVLVIGMVITLEIVNTAIENICNFISPDKHDMIKKIKDLSAAAVLVSAIIAFIIGVLIFLPKILILC